MITNTHYNLPGPHGTHIVTGCMIAFLLRAARDSHGNEDQINIAGVQGGGVHEAA